MAKSDSIKKIEFYKHNIDEEDIARAAESLRSLILTTGEVVEEFEGIFANYLGVKYAVAVSSCTAALHLALLALGISRGHEVITTPMTFIATSNAILYTGATPVFVDVDKETGLIDNNKVRDAITSKTKAVLPVHLYGQMCNLNELTFGGVRLLEDAAHCIDSTGRCGYKQGGNSDGACFSFYPTKSITSGEGGAFATNNKVIADKVRTMRNHGMTKGAYERYGKNYQHWNMVLLGYNYRMSNVQASLLLGQMDRIDSFRQRRVEIWGLYEKGFSDNPKIGIIKTDASSAKLMFTILVEDRDRVLQELQEGGIGVAVHYRALHLLGYYKKRFGYTEGDFPNAEYIGNHTLTLPLYPKLTNLEVEYVIEKVKEVVR